jgi:hypothetical protein
MDDVLNLDGLLAYPLHSYISFISGNWITNNVFWGEA